MTDYPPAVRDALAAFDAAASSECRTDDWDKSVLDTLIEHYASLGMPFSSNDFREYLPDVRKLLISRRLIAAQNRGLIRSCGFTRSTLASTHGAFVRVYEPIPAART